MELLDCLSGEAVTSLIKQRVKHYVEHTCKGNFEIQYLQILHEVKNKDSRFLNVLENILIFSDFRLSRSIIYIYPFE